VRQGRIVTRGTVTVAASDAGQVPVIVGVGQMANKDPARILSPLDLVREALVLAIADSGAPLLPHIDAVFATPASVFAERSLADEIGDHLGLAPTARTASGFSGAAPLTLLAAACRDVVSGHARVALVGGAMAEASIKIARAQGIAPVAAQAAPWSQGSGARLEFKLDDGRARRYRGAETAAGVRGPAEIFALLESAFAGEAGRDPADHRAWLGTLMAPFTAVAATHPELAWFPHAREPIELSTVSADNRLVAEPYPKLMNSFPTVDQTAVILVTTEAHADALGVRPDARIYPLSSTHCVEIGPPSTRPVVHRSLAIRTAIERALTGAGLGVDDVSAFDLYSCFPAAVQLSLDALGIAPNDPRGLTLTGGLPYFGGPGANYVTHAIACAAESCRRAPGSNALVVGLGGAPSDFAAGVFSAVRPATPWSHDECDDVTPRLEAVRVRVHDGREGDAVVDAMTILHDRDDGPTQVSLVASFDDGARAGARSTDAGIARALSGTSLVGHKVRIFTREGRSYFDAG
jgi:acetyl-CoA C-acetyltransferase